MQPFIEEFCSSFQLQPPSDCVDVELYCGIKVSQICRAEAFDEGHPFRELGERARQWIQQDEIVDRLSSAIHETSSEMRSLCYGVYILHRLQDYVTAAKSAMADVDWGVRCTACEALHDLGLYGNAPTALSPRLVRLALEDPNFIVRSRASQALRFYRSPDVILALRQVQAHDHESDEEYMVEAASAMAGESLRHIESAENSGG